MGITAKLTWILASAGLLLFGASGLWMLHAERLELTRAIDREMSLLAGILAPAAERAIVAADPDGLASLLQGVSAGPEIDPAVAVEVFDRHGTVLFASGAPRHGPQPADRVGPSSQVTIDGMNVLVRTVPLAGGEGGTLVLTRPLTDMAAELERTRRDILLTVLAFGLLATLLGSVLGTVLVTRPLGRLGQALRRVRIGDLEPALPEPGQRDEVAQLTVEFNRMVAALKDARARLEQEAEARRDLQRSLQQAEKLITIGQLSAGLAHEIGSPLQVLGGRARQLAGRADLPEDARSHAEIIAGQTERIARIVEQLLRYSRRQPQRFRPMDLAAVAGDLVDFLQFDARQREVTLRFDAAAGLPALDGNPDQVQQILFNLVTNALQATPAGGEVVVAVEAAAGSEDELLISVRDTGAGIAAADQARLFEPFFTTRDAVGGVGLGLAVVRTLVAEQGGRIELESGPGSGSLFRVWLPRRHPAMRSRTA